MVKETGNIINAETSVPRSRTMAPVALTICGRNMERLVAIKMLRGCKQSLTGRSGGSDHEQKTEIKVSQYDAHRASEGKELTGTGHTSILWWGKKTGCFLLEF